MSTSVATSRIALSSRSRRLLNLISLRKIPDKMTKVGLTDEVEGCSTVGVEVFSMDGELNYILYILKMEFWMGTQW